MKAMIVDDEKHVREGLMLLADWEKFGIDTVFEAENGEEATKLILKHQPEIIFTDMRMPKRDGMSLLKWIYEQNLSSKTIVVSGYDDFDYMRHAIFYKSFDYLLKPIDPDVLNETLKRAVAEWKEQAKTRKASVKDNQVMNEVKQLYMDKLFSGLLYTKVVSKDVDEKLKKQLPVDVLQKPVTVATMSVQPLIDHVFLGDADLCFFSLNNISHELFTKQEIGVSFRNLNKEAEFVIVCWDDKDLRYVLNRLHSTIYQFTNVYCKVALGERKQSIKEAYESSVTVCKKHSLLFNQPIVTVNDISNRPILHLLDYSQDLFWALKSGNVEQMDDVLNKIFQTLETSYDVTREQIEDWEKEFALLRKSWLTEYEIEQRAVLYEGKSYWNQDGSFSMSLFKREKRKEFLHLIQTLQERKYQTEENNIQKIAAYLREHYHEDIQLQAIADRFFLSREYISRKFKQEFNETITDYVTNIRMEKAKELLLNPHLKIYEIAFQVGYHNEKYFSKVFKKAVGMSPNEYRHQWQARSRKGGF